VPVRPTKITPCLWFDGHAEQAAKHYVSIFKDSKIGRISRYGAEGHEIHGREPGSVMVVEFELDGQKFIGLNGGPQFTFSEAVSFSVECEDQAEVDYFWETLSEGGEEGPCGWLKDKFGLFWQVVPSGLPRMLSDGNAEQAARVTKAFMQMTKFDIAELQRAYDGSA
jgi:predicted 3-demethylubiquinone-9 3-methyltransferase (glyoxalase superfamily)